MASTRKPSPSGVSRVTDLANLRKQQFKIRKKSVQSKTFLFRNIYFISKIHHLHYVDDVYNYGLDFGTNFCTMFLMKLSG